jgi:hypothetical protein
MSFVNQQYSLNWCHVAVISHVTQGSNIIASVEPVHEHNRIAFPDEEA